MAITAEGLWLFRLAGKGVTGLAFPSCFFYFSLSLPLLVTNLIVKKKKKSVNWKVLGDISLTGLGSVGHAVYTVWLLLT